jgi:hypothetical protein
MALRSADWTKQRVLEELRRRAGRGHVLRINDLPAPLKRAIHRYWGTMAAARAAARLPPVVPGRRYWTVEKILAAVRKLDRAGVHLSYNDVVKAGHQALVVAANTHLGGWTRARELAGVRFKKRRPRVSMAWDASSVVAAIRRRNDGGETLAVTKTPSSLVSAAQRNFGSWREAVDAAGLDYDQVLLRHDVTDAQVQQWLRKLARAHPRMKLHELEQRGEHVVACRRRWGSLEEAAQAAGLQNWPVRVRRSLLSREQVIQAIRRRIRAGKAVNFAAVRSERGTQLADSALKRFATWDEAVSAARG